MSAGDSSVTTRRDARLNVAQQAAPANADSETAGVQIALTIGRNVVHESREPHRVMLAMPGGSFQREARLQGPVDIGEFVGLDICRSLPRSGEEAQILDELLLQRRSECHTWFSSVKTDWITSELIMRLPTVDAEQLHCC